MDKKWHVLYTKPRNEKKATERLLDQGFEMYCPVVDTIRQWSDRKKKVKVPMFTSYIFAHVTEEQRFEVLKDPGVLNFVFWLGKPAVIRKSEIHAIRRIAEEGQSIQVENEISSGDIVTIPNGPFKGLQGKVDQVNINKIAIWLEPLRCLVHFKL